jgi:hypothetical protein
MNEMNPNLPLQGPQPPQQPGGPDSQPVSGPAPAEAGTVPPPSEKGYSTIGETTAPSTSQAGTVQYIATSSIPQLPVPTKDDKTNQPNAQTLTTFVNQLSKGNLEEQINNFTSQVASPKAAEILKEGLAENLFDETYARAFESLVSQEKGNLPDRLRFAHHHPTLPNLLTPEEKKTLQRIESESLNVAKESVPAAGEHRPQLNTIPFNEKVNAEFSQTYKEALEHFVQTEKLSPEDQLKLEYLFNQSPELGQLGEAAEFQLPPGWEHLKNVNKKILDQMIAKMQTTFAMPLTDIQGNRAQHTVMLNGLFSEFFAKECEALSIKPKSSFTANEVAQLKKALKNPNDPTVPKELRDYAIALKRSLGQMQDLHGVPKTWMPELTAEVPALNPFIKSAMDFVEDNLMILGQYLDQGLGPKLQKASLAAEGGPGGVPPKGPEEIELEFNFAEFQNIIARAKRVLQKGNAYSAEIFGALSTEASNLSRVQIKQDSADRAEMRKQQEKAEQTQLAMKILGPILLIVGLLISLATMNPAAMVVAVAMFVLTIVDTILEKCDKKPLLTMMFEEIDKAIENDPLLKGNKGFQMFVKALFTAAALAATIVAAVASGGAAAGAVFQIFATFFQSSKIIDLACNMTGADDKVRMALTIAFTAALAIAGLAISFASMKGAMNTAAKSILERVIQKIKDQIRPVMIGVQVTASTLEISDKAIRAATSFMKSQIALIEGFLEMAESVTQGNEEVRKQRSKEFQKFIEENGEFAAVLGKLMVSTRQSQAAASASIFS